MLLAIMMGITAWFARLRWRRRSVTRSSGSVCLRVNRAMLLFAGVAGGIAVAVWFVHAF